MLLLLLPSQGASQVFDVIVPGQRIGQLQLAGKLADVRKVVGQETRQDRGAVRGTTLYVWEQLGLEVTVDDITGNVLEEFVGTPQGANPWAEYRTPEGLGFGSTDLDITQILGAPSRISDTSPRSWRFIAYYPRGITFLMPTSGSAAGRTFAVGIYWPRVQPSGDTRVISGVRISSIELGMSLDKVIATLGGGYIQSAQYAEYFWPQSGLGVHVTGVVDAIRATWDQELEDAGVRYATENELKWKSTVQQLKTVLGEPSQRSRTGFVETWIYSPRGIAFAVDVPSETVLSISVFRCQGQGWACAPMWR